MPGDDMSGGLDRFLQGGDSLEGGAIMMNDPEKREKIATGMFVGFLTVGILTIIGLQVATYMRLHKEKSA